MRYPRGTLEYGMVEGGLNGGVHILIGFVDFDFSGNLDKKKTPNMLFIHFKGLHYQLESNIAECSCFVHNRS